MHRIALFGAGVMGREHARLLRKHAELDLCVIADPAPEAKAFAESLDVPWCSDFEQALDTYAPAGAVVACPNQLHLKAGAACLARQVVPLIEKPVTDKLADARELLMLEAKHRTPILVGHHRRHSPDMQRARELVNDGTIGRLVVTNGMWFTRKHDAYFEQAWRRQAGGGPFWINLIHEVDCLRFVCGEIDAVFATATNRNRNSEVEDTAAITVAFVNGAVGSFAMSDSVPSPFMWDVASGQALYFPAQPADCFFFGGTRGTLAVPSMDLWTHAGEGDWRDRLHRTHMGLERAACYERQLDNFAGVLAGREQPLVTGLDGARTVAVIVAIERSAREARPVRLSEVDPVLEGATPER